MAEQRQEGAPARAPAVDLRDVVALVALGMVAAGCYLIWLPLALLVPGFLLLFLAVWGMKRGPAR